MENVPCIGGGLARSDQLCRWNVFGLFPGQNTTLGRLSDSSSSVPCVLICMLCHLATVGCSQRVSGEEGEEEGGGVLE